MHQSPWGPSSALLFLKERGTGPEGVQEEDCFLAWVSLQGVILAAAAAAVGSLPQVFDGAPHAFFPRDVPGFGRSFPLWFPRDLSADRLRHLFAHAASSGYLSKRMAGPETLHVQVRPPPERLSPTDKLPAGLFAPSDL